MKTKIEIIVTNVEEAILAEKYGADRLELIHDFDLGGLSPALALSQKVCAAVKIPVCVMVRPHGRNFIYNDAQAEQILKEIIHLRDHTQAYGIVFGALTEQDQLDRNLLAQVLQNKGRLALTFHRAIDAATSPLACLKELLEYDGIDLILTSGGKPTALEGMVVIKKMVALSKNYSTRILAGSGINPDNAKEIIDTTGVTQIHIGTGVRTHGLLDAKKFHFK